MLRLRQLLAPAMALLLTAPVAPQQEDAKFRIRTTVELVVVPVTVKDRQGNPVADVRRDEFRIFEDGVEQEVAVFSVDPFPLSAVVLIDNGLTPQTAQQVQRSAGAIAGGFSPSDEVAVGVYEAFYQPVADFITDNDKLHDQLRRLELNTEFPGQGSGPMTAGPRINTGPPLGPGVPKGTSRSSREVKNLDDAVFAAAQMLRTRARERRKIILLVSDGSNSRNNTVTYDDALKALLSADISVYAIGVGPAALNRTMSPLARYARATGGDVFFTGSRADLESTYALATEQARNQYTLAYVPRQTDRSREYHSIEVRVRRANLTLLARDGYFLVVTP